MIKKDNTDGTFSIISDPDAEKLRKFDKIVEILSGSDPYHGNRETCDKIRRVTEGSDTDALPMSDIRRIAAYYGTEDQTRQLVEEMAELMVALSKWKRNEGNVKVQDELRESMANDIVTEIADVRIMLEQIIFLYGIPESRIDSEIRYKVKRQIDRIEASKTAEPGNATKIGDRLWISSET